MVSAVWLVWVMTYVRWSGQLEWVASAPAWWWVCKEFEADARWDGLALVEACFVAAQCSHCAFVVADVILCCPGSTRWDLVLGAHDCASETDIDEVLAKVVELVDDGLSVLCISLGAALVFMAEGKEALVW